MPHIAYFGPSGTFTEMALADLESANVFAGPVERVPAPSPPAALEMVRSGAVEGAVVPFESSIEGSISTTLDALAVGARLQIVAETEIAVAFEILAAPGTAISDVRTLAVFPVALAQVREWVERTLPGVRIHTSASNAAAAEDVAAGYAEAAVSTTLAGQRLGLTALASGVADHDQAVTRFVLVRRPCAAPAPTGSDRTSIVMELPNVPGSLMRAFAEFATRGIDLTRIESRPTRTGMGAYRFYLDCVGHLDDPAVAEALKALHRTSRVRFLGSWPTASRTGTPPPSDEEAAQWLTQLRKGVADL